ncbi:MAG TPA: hypothetical protein VEI83_02465 [Acidimicrobiales bacterium]|nr:hypothetical protein [Acidimicrobiales bacterium]
MTGRIAPRRAAHRHPRRVAWFALASSCGAFVLALVHAAGPGLR